MGEDAHRMPQLVGGSEAQTLADPRSCRVEPGKQEDPNGVLDGPATGQWNDVRAPLTLRSQAPLQPCCPRGQLGRTVRDDDYIGLARVRHQNRIELTVQERGLP